MGRVRLGKKATSNVRSGLVIGVDRDGSLALAQYDREVWNRSYWVDLHDDHPVTVCASAARRDSLLRWGVDDEGERIFVKAGDRHDEKAASRSVR